MSSASSKRLLNQIPQEILTDPALNQLISHLPANYNFEIHKCIWKIQSLKAHCIALQLPEGLLRWACLLSDIFSRFGSCSSACESTIQIIIMGDVTYGACCIDDFIAHSLGADLLIHYGHSCLVPIDVTKIPVHYVFVDIAFDPGHLISVLREIFSSFTVALMGTVQFLSTINLVASQLAGEMKIIIPQEKPLSRGELLGCTAPNSLKALGVQKLVYVADGRFHLEAVMIANPDIPAFAYDPYSKCITSESYDHSLMLAQRHDAILRAKSSISSNSAAIVGLIIGTLGRQSSPSSVSFVEKKLKELSIPFAKICISEISPTKLALFPRIAFWIQTSCPRLSIDWGFAYEKPLLSPYEAAVLFQAVEWNPQAYPMNFYSKPNASPWTPYWKGQNSHISEIEKR